MRLISSKTAMLAGLASLVLLGSASAETRYFDHSSQQWVVSGGGANATVPSAGATLGRAPVRVARQPQAMRPVDPRFKRQTVRISTKEKPGTIIIDTDRKFLYFVEPGGMATRYGVGVGKEGFAWGGTMKIGRKAEWPGWTPPATMVARERAKGRILPARMDGGLDNPLGARALYLGSSLYRIHGTNQPWTIGLNMSSGCIRMMNEDVMHLYDRADRGTKVIVLGPGQSGSDVYAEAGTVRQPGRGLLAAVFGG